MQVPGRVGLEAGHAAPRTRQRAGHVGERPAVTRDHHTHRQAFDEVQHRGHIVEAGLADHLGEDRAEAVLPQCVGRNQHAVLSVEVNQRVFIVPRRGQCLPLAAAGHPGPPGVHRAVGVEPGHQLPAGAVGEGAFVPFAHGLGVARRHGGERTRFALQQRVAAAVIAVQVGVDNARQRLALKRVLNERQRLIGVVDVPGVDQHRAGFARGGVNEDVVAGQPAAFEDAQARQRDWGQGGGLVHGAFSLQSAARA